MNLSGTLDSGANIVAGDLPHAGAQQNSPAAGYAAHPGAAHGNGCAGNDSVRSVLERLESVVEGAGRGCQVRDDAAAHAARTHHAVSAIADGAVHNVAGKRPHFGAAGVQHGYCARLAFRHSAPVLLSAPRRSLPLHPHRSWMAGIMLRVAVAMVPRMLSASRHSMFRLWLRMMRLRVFAARAGQGRR